MSLNKQLVKMLYRRRMILRLGELFQKLAQMTLLLYLRTLLWSMFKNSIET